MLIGRSRSTRYPGLPRDPELAHRRERYAALQHLEGVAADLVEQRAIDRRHDEPCALVAPVLGSEAPESVGVVRLRAVGLELHQAHEFGASAAREDVLDGEPETRELVGREVHAVAARILAHV